MLFAVVNWQLCSFSCTFGTATVEKCKKRGVKIVKFWEWMMQERKVRRNVCSCIYSVWNDWNV